MKKKLFAILLAVVMVASVVAVLAACDKTGSEVQAAIDAAQKMSLKELEDAAKAEFEAANIKFTAKATTSGVGKVLTKFKAKYTWFDFNEFSSSKDGAAAEA